MIITIYRNVRDILYFKRVKELLRNYRMDHEWSPGSYMLAIKYFHDLHCSIRDKDQSFVIFIFPFFSTEVRSCIFVIMLSFRNTNQINQLMSKS